jgi:hypothetical protein
MNSIFYRTYWKDYPWLRVSLESLKRHAKGWDRIVVTIAESSRGRVDYEALKEAHPNIEFTFVPEVCKNDYIGQQFTKMNADNWCPEGNVAFVDSDCILFEDFTPQSLIQDDGKILWLYTPYAEIPIGAVPWQAPTEAFLGKTVDHEFMRRHPMMIRTQTMERTRELCMETHGQTLESYLQRIDRQGGKFGTFSEFNVMGAAAYYDEAEHQHYHWMNPGLEPSRPYMKQFWSWGGIEKAKAEIAKMGYVV